MLAKQRWFSKINFTLLLIMFGGLILAGCGAASQTPTRSAELAATPTTAPVSSPTTAATPTSAPLATVTPAATIAPATSAAATPTRPASTPAANVTTAINVVTPTAAASSPANPTATTVPSARPVSSRLAYIDNNNLFVLDTANGQKIELLKGGQSTIVGDPDWSQAANLIAIALQVKGKGALLQTLTPSGTNPKTLITDQPEGSSDQYPVFAPNGRLLAFTRMYDTNKDGAFNRLDSRQEVWLVESNGQNPRKLADGRHPAWAPDSQRIAFVTNGETKTDYNFLVNNSLKLINAQGQNEWEPFNPQKVPTDLSQFEYPFDPATLYIQYPSFVDGGRKIAFSTVGSSGLIITINSSSGSEFKLWNANPEGGFGRTFGSTAGGTKLLYESLPPSGTRIVTLVDTSQNATLTKLQNKNFGDSKTQTSALFPAWSNDAGKIVYVDTKATNYDGAITGSLILATTKTDGTWEQKELLKGTFSGTGWEK